jgi:hypothetical protein
MGALSIANVMGNSMGKEMLSKLQEIMRSKPNLVSLCGIADDATEANLSGLGMDADDAIILASELPDKRALSLFDISTNSLGAEGSKALAEALNGNQVMTELNIGSNKLTEDEYGIIGGDMSGVIALANAIPGMGAMRSLNLTSNVLGVKGARIIAACLPKCT